MNNDIRKLATFGAIVSFVIMILVTGGIIAGIVLLIRWLIAR